jgi:hypothetical protein
LPFTRALLDYTNLYVRFGLGRQPDEANAGWQEYVAGLADTRDPGEWTYRFYLARADVDTSPRLVASVGCFGYGRIDERRIRLHFRNAETDGHAPLGIARRDRRLAELRALFDHVERTELPSVRVVGASWLYNLEAYRRVFPPSYLATAHVLHDRFQRMPLWGQLLDRTGNVNERMARPFVEALGRQSSMDGLERCFPFHVLGVEAPAREFFAFYGDGLTAAPSPAPRSPRSHGTAGSAADTA